MTISSAGEMVRKKLHNAKRREVSGTVLTIQKRNEIFRRRARSVSDCDLFLFVSWRRARHGRDGARVSLRCTVCSSFYRVRRTVKKVQSPKVVLGRPHKPCHKLSLKAALGGSCSPTSMPTSYGPNRAAPPKVSTCIYDRPGPWGGDSIEPKIKEGEEGPENRPCSLPLKQSRRTGR